MLIIVALFNLHNFNPFKATFGLQETPIIEQESFAPLFIPQIIPETSQEQAQGWIFTELIELSSPVEFLPSIAASNPAP